MTFLGDWGWQVGKGSSGDVATACRLFFAQWLLFWRIGGRQPDTSLAATYLIVPHVHKAPRTAYQLLLTLPVTNKRRRRKSLLKAVAHQVKATDNDESRKAGSAHVLRGREWHLAVSFYWRSSCEIHDCSWSPARFRIDWRCTCKASCSLQCSVGLHVSECAYCVSHKINILYMTNGMHLKVYSLWLLWN